MLQNAFSNMTYSSFCSQCRCQMNTSVAFWFVIVGMVHQKEATTECLSFLLQSRHVIQQVVPHNAQLPMP
eukprot:5860792-Amphidinium_carterae.1